MRKSSKGVLLLPIEEGDVRYAIGLRKCAALFRRSADRMRSGKCDGNWRMEVGTVKLLEKLAGLAEPRRKGAGKKVQEHQVEGEAMETSRRKSDGKKSHVPRKALVV